MRKLYMLRKGSEQIIKNIKTIVLACAAAVLASGTAAVSYEASSLPDSLNVAGSMEVNIASRPYIEFKSPKDETADAAVTVNSSYTVTATLYGILPIKNIEVTRVKPEYVELSGQPVGILLYSDGLTVAGLSPVDTADGHINPGEQCGLHPGDVIRKINGHRPENAQDMLDMIAETKGSPLDIEIIRPDKSTADLVLTPVYSKTDSAWRAGIWLKESSSGLGMLTFVTADKETFGGLGHAICDADTGSLIKIYGGDLMNAKLTGVVPGAKGMPGKLLGTLGSERLGIVSVNCETGVYGQFLDEGVNMPLTRVAMKQELKEGRAQMLTTLPGDDKPELYNVIIEQINYDENAPTRNLIVRVDDPDVINSTGGIVQGMSGSPIIQDGKLVGAVTHVLVNDPTRGYGIFIENMLEAAA